MVHLCAFCNTHVFRTGQRLVFRRTDERVHFLSFLNKLFLAIASDLTHLCSPPLPNLLVLSWPTFSCGGRTATLPSTQRVGCSLLCSLLCMQFPRSTRSSSLLFLNSAHCKSPLQRAPPEKTFFLISDTYGSQDTVAKAGKLAGTKAPSLDNTQHTHENQIKALRL